MKPGIPCRVFAVVAVCALSVSLEGCYTPDATKLQSGYNSSLAIVKSEEDLTLQLDRDLSIAQSNYVDLYGQAHVYNDCLDTVESDIDILNRREQYIKSIGSIITILNRLVQSSLKLQLS